MLLLGNEMYGQSMARKRFRTTSLKGLVCWARRISFSGRCVTLDDRNYKEYFS